MRSGFILIIFLLTGCATKQPLVVTASCPKPNIPAESHYPVQDLKQDDKPDQVMKAYVATVQGQQDYIMQLKHILMGYE